MIDTKFDKKTESAPVSGKPLVRTQESEHSEHQQANEPTREEIAALAYELWIQRGSPHGSHEDDWQQAEEQLRNQPMNKSANA